MRRTGVGEGVAPWLLGDENAGLEGVKQPRGLKLQLGRRIGKMLVAGPRQSDGAAGEVVDGKGADIARGLTEADEMAARRQRADRSLERVLADGVVDDIRAAPFSQPH